jgi:fructoselysine 6-kinase
MKKTARIAFMGDLTADKYMPHGDVRLGGAALNGAIWAKRQGAVSSVVSAIATDEPAKEFVQKLRKEKIQTASVQKKRGKTSSIEIFVGAGGERRYGKWDPGVLARYHVRPKDKKTFASLDAIVITVYPPYEHVLDELSAWKKRIKQDRRPLFIVNYGDLKEFENSLDVVLRHSDLADINVFGLNKDEDEVLINDIRTLTMSRRMMSIVTLGKFGSIVWKENETYVQPAQEVEAVDTTGAGDAFLAAFAVSYLKTQDIQKSLLAGTTCATQVIQKVGAY